MKENCRPKKTRNKEGNHQETWSEYFYSMWESKDERMMHYDAYWVGINKNHIEPFFKCYNDWFKFFFMLVLITLPVKKYADLFNHLDEVCRPFLYSQYLINCSAILNVGFKTLSRGSPGNLTISYLKYYILLQIGWEYSINTSSVKFGLIYATLLFGYDT